MGQKGDVRAQKIIRGLYTERFLSFYELLLFSGLIVITRAEDQI